MMFRVILGAFRAILGAFRATLRAVEEIAFEIAVVRDELQQ